MRSFANGIEFVIVRQGRISAIRPQQAVKTEAPEGTDSRPAPLLPTGR